MRGVSIKAGQEPMAYASLAMTMRYAHLSHEHLRDSVNLLDDMPSVKEMVNNGLKQKEAATLSLLTSCNSS